VAALPAAGPPPPRTVEHGTTRAKHSPRRAVPLSIAAFDLPFAGAGGAANGGGAGSGAGVAAALALWFCLELPGLAVLRLPAGRRGLHANVDEPPSRPG
jgi:hypothetical protein